MRTAVGIVAFALLTGNSAFAADLGAPAPIAQAVNWTGFYLGGNAGGVIAHASGTSDFTDTTGGSIAPSNPQANFSSDLGRGAGGRLGLEQHKIQFLPSHHSDIQQRVHGYLFRARNYQQQD
jgi:opacity protein-like surface antigen